MTLSSQETRSDRQSDAEIDQAVGSLRGLGKALRVANPADTKELLTAMVSRFELQFNHQETAKGRTKITFREGTVYLRPDLGEGWVIGDKTSRMITKEA